MNTELLSELHTYLALPLPPNDSSVDNAPPSLIRAPPLSGRLEGLLEMELSPDGEQNDSSEQPIIVRQLPMHPIEYFSPSHTVLHALNILQSGISRVGALTQDVS